MKDGIDITSRLETEPDFLPNDETLRRWVKGSLPQDAMTYQVDIHLVEEDEMRELNKTYRKQDKVTDIISFPFASPVHIESQFLGDIVLCPKKLNADAKQKQIPYEARWAHLVIHGTLHLCGFDHIEDNDAEVMMREERRILANFNFPDPYEINGDDNE